MTTVKELLVLSKFRPGDAKIIGFFLDYIWTIYKQDLASELSEADYAALQNTLLRMQEACQLMEG